MDLRYRLYWADEEPAHVGVAMGARGSDAALEQADQDALDDLKHRLGVLSDTPLGQAALGEQEAA